MKRSRLFSIWIECEGTLRFDARKRKAINDCWEASLMAFLYAGNILDGLEDVGNEMVTPMVTSWCGVVVVPVSVVNRNPHFGWVTVVEAVGATVVLVSPVVLWVGHIGVVIKPVHVLGVLLAPSCAVGLLLSVGSFRLAGHCERTNANRNGK